MPPDSFSLIPKIPLFQKIESLSVVLSFPIPDPDKFSVLRTLADLFQMQHLKKLSYFENFLNDARLLEPLSVPLSSSPELLQAPPAAQTLSVPNTLQELHLYLHPCDPRVMELLGSSIEVSEIRDFSFTLFNVRHIEEASYRKVCLEMIALVLPYITKMKHLEHLGLIIPFGKRAQDQERTASDDRLKSLHTMLKSTKTLKKLNIDIPDMIPYCVDYICDGLKSNSTLSELEITSYHSCDLFTILDSLSIHRMENIYLSFFTPNELMKIWNVILNCNILSEFQNISVFVILMLIRNSDSMKVQKVNIQWDYVDSCDAFEILNSLKDRCQNIKNLKLTFNGMLVSTHTTESKEYLLTVQQDTTQCKIGEMLAYFLLNCDCTFDFSAICPHHHPQPLYLDLQMSFVTPYLSHGMSDFPQDSFLLYNKIIYTKYGPEHGNIFTNISDIRNQHRSRCNMCDDITMTHCFELHLQPVSELPPHLQCLSPTLSSLQQIVSTQKCVRKITAHAKKYTPIFEKLEKSKYVSEEDHDCWIYIAVDIRVMGSDHVTVQSQLKWIVDADKIECPYVKHVKYEIYDWVMDKEDRKMAYPEYFRGDEEDLGDVISDIPFLKPQHQNTSQS